METLESILKAAADSLRRTAGTRRRYRLPFGEGEVTPLLTDAYAALVVSRGGEYASDETTEGNLRKVSRWLTSQDTKPMLMLYGGVGNGKTTMARAVISLSKAVRKAYEEESRKTTDRKRSDALFVAATAVLVPSMWTAQDIANLAGRRREEYEAVSARPFLIVDDLGCEPAVVKSYGTEVTPITELIYRRYDTMSPTIVTTNLSKPGIRSMYGDRVADRFNEVFETIGYTGGSFRR